MQVQAFENFRENLRQIMLDRGLTQAELAEKLGTKAPYISRVLNGHTVPGLEVCDNISDELGVPLSKLVSKPRVKKSDKISV